MMRGVKRKTQEMKVLGGSEADPGDQEMGNDGEQDSSTSEPLLKKWCYHEKKCAQHNRILMFIVRHSTHIMNSSA